MSFGGALFAMSALSAINSVTKGYAQNREAQANADLIQSRTRVSDQQIKMIGIQQSIDEGRYVAKGSKAASKSQAAIGASGVAFQGSAVAHMVETQRQINIDKAISSMNYETDKFNVELEKSDIQTRADAERRSGRRAISTGYGNAFSSMLQGGYAYASYKGTFKKKG